MSWTTVSEDTSTYLRHPNWSPCISGWSPLSLFTWWHSGFAVPRNCPSTTAVRINPLEPFRTYLWISSALISAVCITQVLIIALQCIPLAALWGGAKGKCMGSEVVFLTTAIMTVACDSPCQDHHDNPGESREEGWSYSCDVLWCCVSLIPRGTCLLFDSPPARTIADESVQSGARSYARFT